MRTGSRVGTRPCGAAAAPAEARRALRDRQGRANADATTATIFVLLSLPSRFCPRVATGHLSAACPSLFPSPAHASPPRFTYCRLHTYLSFSVPAAAGSARRCFCKHYRSPRCVHPALVARPSIATYLLPDEIGVLHLVLAPPFTSPPRPFPLPLRAEPSRQPRSHWHHHATLVLRLIAASNFLG
eukprot:6200480-Pleurochrysis_carterae.AAC.4